MKEISNLTALLRMVLYDVLGLLIPGLFLLALLLMLVGYLQNSREPLQLLKDVQVANKTTIYGVLIAAYALGYLLQSISAFHSKLLFGLGDRLLHKQELETQKSPSGRAVATRFAERHFASTPFFQVARRIIAHKAGFEYPRILSYADVSSLAFSFAGDEADLARQFRFRADFCGAMSTMSLFVALGIAPVLVLKSGYHWHWCLVPALLFSWIAALGRWPRSFLTRRLWFVAPLVLLGGLWLLAHCTRQGSFLVSVFPAVVAVWFFMLWRAYFYLELGGTVHFSMAVAAIAQGS